MADPRYVTAFGQARRPEPEAGLEFLEQNLEVLATRPVWLFSSGPVPGSSKDTGPDDPLTLALGPAEGTGSGGRRRIAALSTAIHPRDHRVFLGAFDPHDQPKSLQERVVRLMPGSKVILPAGDFREWDAIESWARQIAQGLPVEVPWHRALRPDPSTIRPRIVQVGRILHPHLGRRSMHSTVPLCRDLLLTPTERRG